MKIMCIQQTYLIHLNLDPGVHCATVRISMTGPPLHINTQVMKTDRSWRGMLIKDNGGDWGVAVAAWRGMKKGQPGVPGTHRLHGGTQHCDNYYSYVLPSL